MLTKVRKYWMRMAGIMDQVTCGEVHNAILRSVFPTGIGLDQVKIYPFFKFVNSVEKNTPFSWFVDMQSLKKMTPFSVKLWTRMRTHYLPSGSTGFHVHVAWGSRPPCSIVVAGYACSHSFMIFISEFVGCLFGSCWVIGEHLVGWCL